MNVITDLKTAQEFLEAHKIVFHRDPTTPKDSLRHEESLRKIQEFTGGTYFVNIEVVYLSNLRVDIPMSSRDG